MTPPSDIGDVRLLMEGLCCTCASSVLAATHSPMRRAHDGVRKPVYQGGKRVRFIRESSDVLLIFLLKAYGPESIAFQQPPPYSLLAEGVAIKVRLARSHQTK